MGSNATFYCKTLVTLFALERTCTRVDGDVVVEPGGARETLATNVTHKGLLARVGHHVPRQARVAAERFRAFPATEGFTPGMKFHVRGQVAFVCKFLSALALERFLPRVYASVPREMALLPKLLAAFLAFTAFLAQIRMHFHMLVQCLYLQKRQPTVDAEVAQSIHLHRQPTREGPRQRLLLLCLLWWLQLLQ